MPEAKRKEHDFITHGRVMKWYHARCEFHNIANHHLVKMTQLPNWRSHRTDVCWCGSLVD